MCVCVCEIENEDSMKNHWDIYFRMNLSHEENDINEKGNEHVIFF